MIQGCLSGNSGFRRPRWLELPPQYSLLRFNLFRVSCTKLIASGQYFNLKKGCRSGTVKQDKRSPRNVSFGSQRRGTYEDAFCSLMLLISMLTLTLGWETSVAARLTLIGVDKALVTEPTGLVEEKEDFGIPYGAVRGFLMRLMPFKSFGRTELEVLLVLLVLIVLEGPVVGLSSRFGFLGRVGRFGRLGFVGVVRVGLSGSERCLFGDDGAGEVAMSTGALEVREVETGA